MYLQEAQGLFTEVPPDLNLPAEKRLFAEVAMMIASDYKEVFCEEVGDFFRRKGVPHMEDEDINDVQFALEFFSEDRLHFPAAPDPRTVSSYASSYYQGTSALRRRLIGIKGVSDNLRNTGRTRIQDMLYSLPGTTLNMCSFRGGNGGGEHGYENPEQMHACGTTACLSGHIRIDETFRNTFNFLEEESAQILTKLYGRKVILGASDTVAAILNVPGWFADLMIYPAGGQARMDKHILYHKPFHEVTKYDIIRVVQILKDYDRFEAAYEAIITPI